MVASVQLPEGWWLTGGWPVVGQWLAGGWSVVGQWLAGGWSVGIVQLSEQLKPEALRFSTL